MKTKIFFTVLLLSFFCPVNQSVFGCPDNTAKSLVDARKFGDAQKYLEQHFNEVAVRAGDVCANAWLAKAKKMKGQEFIEQFEKGIAAWVPSDLEAKTSYQGIFTEYAVENLALGENEMKAGNLDKAFPHIYKARVWSKFDKSQTATAVRAAELLAQFWSQKGNFQQVIFYCDEVLKSKSAATVSNLRNNAVEKEKQRLLDTVLENNTAKPAFQPVILMQFNVLFPVSRDLDDTLDSETRYLIMSSNYQAAVENLTEKLQMLSKDNQEERAWYYYWRARLNTALLKPEEAFRDMREASTRRGITRIVTDKTRNQTLVYKGLLSFEVGRYYAYQGNYRKAKTFYDPYMDNIIGKVVKAQDGGVFLVADDLGDAMVSFGDYGIGKQVYDIGDVKHKVAMADEIAKAIREKNSTAVNADGTPNAMKRSEALIGQAKELYSEGKYEEAIAKYTEVISLLKGEDIDSLTIFSARGNIYFDLAAKTSSPKYYEAALADYDRFIKSHPNSEFGYSVRGEIYLRLGKYQEAYNDQVKFMRQPNADRFLVLQKLKSIQTEASRAGVNLALDQSIEKETTKFANEGVEKLAQQYNSYSKRDGTGNLDQTSHLELFDGLSAILSIDPNNQRAIDMINQLKTNLGISQSVSSAEFRKFLVVYAQTANQLAQIISNIDRFGDQVATKLQLAANNISGYPQNEVEFACANFLGSFDRVKRIETQFSGITTNAEIRSAFNQITSLEPERAKVKETCGMAIKRMEEFRKWNADCMSGRIFCE